MQTDETTNGDQQDRWGRLQEENAKMRTLISEVIDGDWTDAAYAAELPSRLAETGWFKRAAATLSSEAGERREVTDEMVQRALGEMPNSGFPDKSHMRAALEAALGGSSTLHKEDKR